MADEKLGDGEDIDWHSDVPASNAIVHSRDEARSLALKIAGEELPDECLFSCITCGWKSTLKFDESEIAALDNDITSYSGPCPTCNSMTLVPHASLFGRDVQTIYERAKKNRLEEHQESANVLVDTLEKRVLGAIGGTLKPEPEEEFDPGNVHDPRPPGQRDDLPDADGIDLDGLKPR
jgi:hypothetical protein